jgi:hypothetical protein
VFVHPVQLKHAFRVFNVAFHNAPPDIIQAFGGFVPTIVIDIAQQVLAPTLARFSELCAHDANLSAIFVMLYRVVPFTLQSCQLRSIVRFDTPATAASSAFVMVSRPNRSASLSAVAL